jgi:glycosyltransferase involved in cell wall biosynthesis
MKISAIIPAKNEENYIPVLLEEIYRQANHEPSIETIVAVAPSKDATEKIARQFRAKVVPGGLPGIGRNAGARIASGEIFFFLDADVVVSENFFRNAAAEFQKKNLDIATAELKTDSKNIWDRIFYRANYDAVMISGLLRIPYAPGACMMVRKSEFLKSGGFDETLTYSEDAELTRRIADSGGKFGVIHSCYAIASNRRFVSEGRAKTAARFFATAWKSARRIKIREPGYYFKNEIWNFENWQSKWEGYVAQMKKAESESRRKMRKIASVRIKKIRKIASAIKEEQEKIIKIVKNKRKSTRGRG